MVRPAPYARENPELVVGDSDFNGFRQLLSSDSSRFRCRSEERFDAGVDFVDGTDTVDYLEHSLPAVVIPHRLGLPPVYFEALLHRRGVIIRAGAARLLGASLDT